MPFIHICYLHNLKKKVGIDGEKIIKLRYFQFYFLFFYFLENIKLIISARHFQGKNKRKMTMNTNFLFKLFYSL